MSNGVERLLFVIFVASAVAWLFYYNYKSLQLKGGSIHISGGLGRKVEQTEVDDFLDKTRRWFPQDASLTNQQLVRKYAAPGQGMRKTHPGVGYMYDVLYAEGWYAWTLKAVRFKYWAWMFGPIILLFCGLGAIRWVIEGFDRSSVDR